MQEVRFGIVQIKKFGEDNYKLTLCSRLATGEKETLKGKQKKEKGKEKLMNNISRARNNITELALCNDWKYFVTLTLDPKRYKRDDLPKFVKDLGQFIRDYRKKYNIEFRYLLIPELHADGKSWHMHGLFSEIPENDLAEHPVWDQQIMGYKIWEPYNEKFGYCSLSVIRDELRTSLYITKYVNKSLENSVTEVGKKMYYCSRGLKKAEKVEEFRLMNPLPFQFPFEGPYSKSIFVDKEQMESINQLMEVKHCRTLDY